MKKIVIILILSFAGILARSQSLGECNQYLYYGRYSSAENIFRQLLEKEPDNPQAWYGFATSCFLQDKYERVYDTLRSVPSQVIATPYYKLIHGTILLHQGRVDEAKVYFDEAIALTKQKNAAILAGIAASYIREKAGDGAFAVELLQKAIKRDKHNASLLVLLGDAYRKAGNSSEGYRAYNKAIEENAGYAEAYYKLGLIFLSQKDPGLYLDYFQRSVSADSLYAPALYRLYVYEYYHDPSKALEYYNRYMAHADHTIQNEYDLADLYYLTNDYDPAIQKARKIITAEGIAVKPRLYKLIGYSFSSLGDTANAISNMQNYFLMAPDSDFIAKDYEAMGALFAAKDENSDSAIFYYQKAVTLEKDTNILYGYYGKLAGLSKTIKRFDQEAEWRGKYYTGNEKAGNIDLFNWGMAHYKSENYIAADSVFTLYATKYPNQSFGHFWQARSRGLIDKEMKEGLAVPSYQNLIAVLQQDTGNSNYKKWIIEAYGYLAAYEANTEKDYGEAIDYFEKILTVDPANADAKKYIAILEKNISGSDSN